MFLSNTTFFLKTRIPVTFGVGDTFTISEDRERELPINTDGKEISIIFRNLKEIERFVVTINNGVCTIVKRGITQEGGDTLAELKREWIGGVMGYITALDFDMIDKDGAEQTISAPLNFDSRITFTNVKLPVFADTTARDAEYTSPVD